MEYPLTDCSHRLALAALLLSASAAMGAPRPPANATESSQGVIAVIGDQRVTEADIVAQDPDDFRNLQEDGALRERQLQQRQAESHYKLVQQQTDKLLDRKALEMEAKARGSTVDAVMAEAKVPAVSEKEERDFFEANKVRANGKTFEQLQPEISQYLAGQHNHDAIRGFLDDLRARHGIQSLLPPFRMSVTAAGPSKGKPSAPVTIIEFGDFQCPYCQQEESAVKSVLERHPDSVRLVFRELPLASIHPFALGAAHAAVCADRQGMFWQMHDAMYQDQGALADSALLQTAQRIGLDTDKFSACLNAEDTRNAVQQDARDADSLNINETPYFLINGRPLHGTVSADKLEAVISEELQRAPSGKHG